MQLRRLVGAIAIVVCVALGGAAPSLATIQPGNQTFTEGGQCTSNFVFHDYMESHGGPDVTLGLGTEPFRGPLLP